ncbi:MAG TPA: triose-phosphate isomerase [Candidatus Paceibacterota bacterium]|nr:triose-phosphate isomerase [Candidatus Paceibacterota bacterium]
MKKYLVFNWKMSPSSLKEAEVLFKILVKNNPSLKIIVAPPFIYLEMARKILQNKYSLCAQDVFWQDRTFATGEISPKMLKSLSLEYAIIGHSERRHYFKETDEMINLKMKGCLNNGLIPILCIGEEKRGEKESSSNFKVKKILFDQLNKAFRGIKLNKKSSVIIAYEPVWAIGGKIPETVQETEKISDLIRFWLLRRFSESIALSIPILYGGSVKAQNIIEFLSLKNISGVLVGSASTNKTELKKILSLVQ